MYLFNSIMGADLGHFQKFNLCWTLRSWSQSPEALLCQSAETKPAPRPDACRSGAGTARRGQCCREDRDRGRRDGPVAAGDNRGPRAGQGPCPPHPPTAEGSEGRAPELERRWGPVR